MPKAIPMKLILISGMSGSGKSVALRVLEDAGYYCVDNLPALMLTQLWAQLKADGCSKVAVAIDMRSGSSIAALPGQMASLKADAKVDVRGVFLDARDDVLIQRFSETRRRHPMASDDTSLAEAIQQERDVLENVVSAWHRIDTSHLRPNALRSFIKEFALPVANNKQLIYYEMAKKLKPSPVRLGGPAG